MTPLKFGAEVKLRPGGKLVGGGITGVVGGVTGAVGGGVTGVVGGVTGAAGGGVTGVVGGVFEAVEAVLVPAGAEFVTTAADPPAQPASTARQPVNMTRRMVVTSGWCSNIFRTPQLEVALIFRPDR